MFPLMPYPTNIDQQITVVVTNDVNSNNNNNNKTSCNVANVDMAMYWHQKFHEFFHKFSYFGNVWQLCPLDCSPIQPDEFARSERDSAKVRYLCKKCGQGWTSMKGCVFFWYWMDIYGFGTVLFKLLGQKCQKCNDNRFEDPLWYPEEVTKVLSNIYHKVGQTYYGFVQPPIDRNRRPGKPRSQHPKDLCQACQAGCCTNRNVANLINNNRINESQLAAAFEQKLSVQ